MKRVFLATLGLVVVFMAGACSSSTDEKASSTNGAKGANEAIQNGSKVPPATAANESSTVAADPMAGPEANRIQGKLKALRDGGGEPIDNAKAEADARKSARPAPENSTFFSYLTDAGYEVRTFTDHPQLLKVEKRIAPDAQSIKVFLRGGRVVELPGNAIASLSTVTASSILAAAGVQQNTAGQQRPSKADPTAETKKPGN